jgi:glycosyltransferase involved in cell wall biosynthesis
MDFRGFATAIAGLLRDDARRSALGREGRAAVENHFNWDRVARDTREFTLSSIRAGR